MEKYFGLLSKKEYKKLARIFKVSEQDIKKAEEIMKELSPYPGRNLTKYANEYIVPDIIVTEEDGIYRINMAGDIPEIKINKEYLEMYKEKKETKDFIRKYEARIKAILSSIEERNKTTVKVVGKILEIQRDFLSNEMTGLKPLTLKEIAGDVGVHESTISRIVSRKYVQMPSGVFPLKMFFSGKLDTTEGEVSSSSIKEKIKGMIENEDKTNPLTDMEISDSLNKQGVNISRRTIAKYRDQADIPSAGMRKRLSIKD